METNNRIRLLCGFKIVVIWCPFVGGVSSLSVLTDNASLPPARRVVLLTDCERIPIGDPLTLRLLRHNSVTHSLFSSSDLGQFDRPGVGVHEYRPLFWVQPF